MVGMNGSDIQPGGPDEIYWTLHSHGAVDQWSFKPLWGADPTAAAATTAGKAAGKSARPVLSNYHSQRARPERRRRCGGYPFFDDSRLPSSATSYWHGHLKRHPSMDNILRCKSC